MRYDATSNGLTVDPFQYSGRSSRLGQFVSFQPSIECRAAQSQRLGGERHVAVARHRLAYEKRLDILEAHFVEVFSHGDGGAQPEISSVDHVALRHEHGALDGMVQLAHVAGPPVIDERPQRGWVEAGDAFAVAPRMGRQEAGGEPRNVLPPVPQRRQVDLDGIETEQRILPEASG